MALRTLSDLPAELLLIIFEPLTTRTILKVGKTCQSLNLVALPVFLERMGMADPETLAVVRPGHAGYGDKLTGLTINFGLIRIQQFVCVLDNYQDEQNHHLGALQSLARNMRRLHQLFRRLSSISGVCLVFHSKWDKWNAESSAFVEFLVAFCDVVETLVVKCCDSIQIAHSHPVELESLRGFQHPKTDSTTIGHFIRHLFSSENVSNRNTASRQLSRIPPPIPLTLPQTPYHSILSRLDLNTNFTFIPRLAAFTLAIIKQSPIISLTLSATRNSVFNELSIKDSIFPQIIDVVPGLQEIKLDLDSDSIFPFALENLARLPNLMNMTFGLTRCCEILFFQHLQRNLVFQELVSFTGSLDQGAHLFGRIKTCPKLNFVNIVIDHHFTQPSWQMMVNRFSLLGKYFAVLEINPRLSLCLSNHGEQLAFRGNADFLSVSRKALSLVSHLTLELPVFTGIDPNSMFAEQVHHVRGWVELFCGLQYLTVTIRHQFTPGLTSAEDIDLDADLTEAVVVACPRLSAVNVFNLHNTFHYHWSSARDDLERGIDGIPKMNIRRNKAPMNQTYACYHF